MKNFGKKSSLNVKRVNTMNVDAQDYPGVVLESKIAFDAVSIERIVGGLADKLLNVYQNAQRFRDQRNLWLASLPEEQQRVVLGGTDYVAQKAFHQDVGECDDCPDYPEGCEECCQPQETSEQPTGHAEQAPEGFPQSYAPKKDEAPNGKKYKLSEDELAMKIVDLVKESGYNPVMLLMKAKKLYTA